MSYYDRQHGTDYSDIIVSGFFATREQEGAVLESLTEAKFDVLLQGYSGPSVSAPDYLTEAQKIRLLLEAYSTPPPSTSLSRPTEAQQMQLLFSGQSNLSVRAPHHSVQSFEFKELFRQHSGLNVLPASLRENWFLLAKSKLSVPSYQRLLHLASKPDGWYGSGSVRLSSKSLRNFLKFWALIQADNREPFISITRDGNLYAEWHKSWKRHLDIEFREDGRGFFGLFDGSEVWEGIGELRDLARALRQRRVSPFRWGI
jgi:hypothetical protein